MSDPALGLLMLALIVIVIMLGFPTAFTLMGLGMVFGAIALYDPSIPWYHNRVLDLMVVLMGVIAFNPMLNAGYNVKLASCVITAGGTLGILIPPSVMIIVYAAVAGQSVVKLYASAMFPGFFLSFLYLVYIIGWAVLNPKIAPRLPESEQKVPVSDWVQKFQQAYSPNMLVGLLAAL